jgi:biopolymer transport protein ExbD
MAINLGNSKGPVSDMNVTPLVDVMLVLLVVFIVTAPLLTPQALNINLPTTTSVAASDASKKNQLSIDASGGIQLNGQSMTHDQLSVRLKELSANPKAQLQIAADQQVSYGRVAEIMALAQSQGVTHLSFLTQTKNRK